MTIHEQLEKTWPTLSFELQMGNIGSELTRARVFHKRGEREAFRSSLDRANELVALTIDDARWKGRRKELTRLMEVIGDWYQQGKEYGVPIEWLAQYATQFVYSIRR